jgi:hypothetical protein
MFGMPTIAEKNKCDCDSCRDRPSIAVMVGVYIWGAITAVVAVGILFVLWKASHFVDQAGEFQRADAPLWLVQYYTVLKEQGGLIGALVGLGALAWAYFFQAMISLEQRSRHIDKSVIGKNVTARTVNFITHPASSATLETPPAAPSPQYSAQANSQPNTAPDAAPKT